MPASLIAQNLCFDAGGRRLLNNVSAQFEPGKFHAIVGRNGSSKSTLLNLLAAQTVPSQGSVFLGDENIHQMSPRQLARALAFLPQSLPNARGMTVKEVVSLGRFPWRSLFAKPTANDALTVNRSMRITGVDNLENRQVASLSGGELQRTWISMLLAQETGWILLDEPTSFLDLSHHVDVLCLLINLSQNKGLGVISILHDINLATRFCDHLIALREGELVFDGSCADFLKPEPLEDVYGVPMSIIRDKQNRCFTLPQRAVHSNLMAP